MLDGPQESNSIGKDLGSSANTYIEVPGTSPLANLIFITLVIS